MEGEKTQNDRILVTERKECTVCGKTGAPIYERLKDRLFDTPGLWDFLWCPSCCLLWMKTVPVAEEFYKIYPRLDRGAYKVPIDIPNTVRENIKNCILKGKYNYTNIHAVWGGSHLGKIIGLVWPLKLKVALSVCFLENSQNGNLLDIGCGTGGFLSRMQALGWKVFGVEPDVNAVEDARKHYNLNLFKGTLEEANFAANTFDAVTLQHVFEHLDDPIRTLKEIQRILKPNGKVVIITPNIMSLCHKKFGRFWYHLDIPRHFYVYSPKSLRILARICKLAETDVFTIGRNVNRTYEASKLIARVDNIGGFYTSHPRITMQDKIEARLFQMVERVLAVLYSDFAEEIVMVSRKIA